jgi:hypothetical protein
MIWKPSKRQGGLRREIIDDAIIKELFHYRSLSRVPERKLFGMNYKTFQHNFNRDIRPNLSRKWQLYCPRHTGKNYEHLLLIKNLRKTYSTLEFSRQLDKWKDSGVALEMTSKKMRHSSTFMTSYHYLCNFDSVDVKKYEGMSYADIFRTDFQMRLNDF